MRSRVKFRHNLTSAFLKSLSLFLPQVLNVLLRCPQRRPQVSSPRLRNSMFPMRSRVTREEGRLFAIFKLWSAALITRVCVVVGSIIEQRTKFGRDMWSLKSSCRLGALQWQT